MGRIRGLESLPPELHRTKIVGVWRLRMRLLAFQSELALPPKFCVAINLFIYLTTSARQYNNNSEQKANIDIRPRAGSRP